MYLCEAIHIGTYSVKILKSNGNMYNVCDITYLPKYIFDNLRDNLSITINDMNIITNYMIILDFYKMFSDIYNSSFRLEKAISERFIPFINLCNLDITDRFINIKDDFTDLKIKNLLKDFKFNESIITTGFLAYNYFKNIYSKSASRYYGSPYINNQFQEFISFDYFNDNEKLENILKENKIEYEIVRRHMFSYYFDISTEYYYKNSEGRKILFCIIYKNNNMAIPFIKGNDRDREYKISSHTYTVYHFLTLFVNQKIFLKEENPVKNKINPGEFIKIVKYLQDMQTYYLSSTRKTILDDSPFGLLISELYGEPKSPKEFKISCSSSHLYFSLDSSNVEKYTEREIENWRYYEMSGNPI